MADHRRDLFTPRGPVSYADDLQAFAISPKAALQKYGVDCILVSPAVVRMDWDIPRILLVQPTHPPHRTHFWNLPRDTVTDEDETILHAVVRALRDTTGLTCDWINCQVGDNVFWVNERGRRVMASTFLVDAKEVKMSHKDYQFPNFYVTWSIDIQIDLNRRVYAGYVWAKKEQVEDEKIEGRKFALGKAKGSIRDALEKGVLDAFIAGLVDKEFNAWLAGEPLGGIEAIPEVKIKEQPA